MLRCLSAIALTALTVTPALAGGDDYRIVERADGTTLIVVAAADLAECQMTLAMVLAPLAVEQDVAPTSTLEAAVAPAHPVAMCVTDEG